MSCRALFLGCLAVFFLVFVMIRPTVAFRMPSTRASHTLDGKRLLSMIDEDTDTNDVFTSLLSKEEYAAAFENIKSNPLTQVTFSQAIQMLNHLDDIVPDSKLTGPPEVNTKLLAESSSLLYKRLQRLKVLRGFGCVRKENLPQRAPEMSPVRMEQLTGLKLEALRPSDRPFLWRIGGIALCASQYALGEALGVDPLTTTIPLTLAALAADQVFLKGSAFESVYQKLFPEYKDIIISHEAGHFLVAYLMGVSLRACVTSAWSAREFNEINGQAGTIFYDSRLTDEMATGKVVRESLDRLSIIIMGGVAAEANKYGKTEGGLDDERQLIDFFQTQVQPGWSTPRVQTQARWAVTQALLLIREHKEAYEALVATLKAAADRDEVCPVGTLIQAIEDNLPQTLPCQAREEELENKKQAAERGLLRQYINKMTFKAGGIQKGAPVPEQELQLAEEREEEMADAVTLFSKKMKDLERGVRRGDLDIAELVKESENNQSAMDRGGGMWLNGLTSRDKSDTSTKDNSFSIPLGVEDAESDDDDDGSKDDGDNDMGDTLDSSTSLLSPPSQVPTTNVPLVSKSKLSSVMPLLPKPVEGYEEKIAALNAGAAIPPEPIMMEGRKRYPETEPWEKGGANVDLLIGPSAEELEGSPTVMLQKHRGYFMKMIENTEEMLDKEGDKIEVRLKVLEEAIEDINKNKESVG